MDSETNKHVEKHKGNSIINIILYFFAVFFILSCIVYISIVPGPAMAILLAGILLLPPIGQRLNSNIKTRIIKDISIFVLFIIFVSNVPTTDNSTNNTIVTSSNNLDSTTAVSQENNNETVIEESSSNVQSTPTFENGEYLGSFVNDKRDGNGTFTWKDGTKYEGTWKENQINGKGKISFSNGDKYEGNFANSKRNGNGTYIFKNGDKYEGNFKDDCMNGEGKYTFSNGDVYNGNFSKNKFNGVGTYTKNGKSYAGTWKDNAYSK